MRNNNFKKIVAMCLLVYFIAAAIFFTIAVKASATVWNNNTRTCDGSGCYPEDLKEVYYPVSKGLPRFKFSDQIPENLVEEFLKVMQEQYFNASLNYEIVDNETALDVQSDRWFAFAIVPTLSGEAGYAPRSPNHYLYNPDKDKYELMAGNIRLGATFLNNPNIGQAQKVVLIVHELSHYWADHSQGDSVLKTQETWEKKRTWKVGSENKPLPIMYPKDSKSIKVMKEDLAIFREVFGLEQDSDTVELAGTVTFNDVPVKAARLTFRNLDNPDYTFNAAIDSKRLGTGYYHIPALKKGRYVIQLSICNPLYGYLSYWKTIPDKPFSGGVASFLRRQGVLKKKKIYKIDTNFTEFNLNFGGVEK